jgi:hypothetical protein
MTALLSLARGHMDKLQRTIMAVIRPGEQSGYVAECVEVPVVTQGQVRDDVIAVRIIRRAQARGVLTATARALPSWFGSRGRFGRLATAPFPGHHQIRSGQP